MKYLTVAISSVSMASRKKFSSSASAVGPFIDESALRADVLSWVLSHFYSCSLSDWPGKLFEIKNIVKFKKATGLSVSTRSIASPVRYSFSRKAAFGRRELMERIGSMLLV
jgi:hypothetical protein